MTGNFSVGYHAPPPSAHTGVADYAWRLFEELRKHGNVVPNGEAASIHVYHLGNNRLHDGIYTMALAMPGVVVLHDAVLHHFLLGRLSEEEYLREWIYNYGEWRRDLGQDLWRDRAGSSADPRYFRYPMLRRVMERAKLVVVHNPGAAAMAKAHGAGRVEIVPHFFEPNCFKPTLFGKTRSSDAPAISEWKKRLGISPETTVFGIFGYLREPKRVVPCLRAFRRIHAIRPKTALLLAGECVSRELDRLLVEETSHPAIYRLYHLSGSEFQNAIACIDCCLNLRYPAAGETSGIAVRLMGIGKPVILSESLENSLFPRGSCLHVTSGIAEAAELLDYMGLVTDFPRIAREIGAEAARYIQAEHSLPRVASRIWELLCDEISATKKCAAQS